MASRKQNYRGKQGRKDSKAKRVNLDNERESKLEKAVEQSLTGKTSSANPLQWWTRNPQLAESATRIGSSYIAGYPIHEKMTESPGVILSFEYAQAINTSNSQALKQAMDSEFSFVMHANSRNYVYAAADQQLMQLAGISLISAIGLGIKAYGVMKKYSPANLATPQAILQGMGFDFEDLKQNYSRMWFDVNRLIARSRQIWIPNDIPLYERWFWMNTKIFIDSNSVKDQMYQYVPAYFWKLNLVDRRGTTLTPELWTAQGAIPENTTVLTNAQPATHTWNEYLELIESLFEPILGSQDRGVIYADLLRAFGANKLYALAEIPVDYTVEIAYEPEVLSQLMNTTLKSVLPTEFTQNKDFDTLILTYGDAVATAPLISLLPTESHILNFKMIETPAAGDFLVSTRMHARGWAAKSFSATDKTISALQPAYFGTDYCSRLFMTTMAYSTSSTAILTPRIRVITGSTLYRNGTVAITSEGILLAHYSAFDWRPMITNYYYGGDPSPVTPNKEISVISNDDTNYITSYWGELENIVPVDSEAIARMHDVCILSALGMPFDLPTTVSRG